MQRLGYRPCVAWRVVRCQRQNVCFNSTDSLPSNLQSSTADEALENSGQSLPTLSARSTPTIPNTPHTVTSGKSSRSHIARSWGNIAIPSREDLSRSTHAKQIVPRIHHSKDFRPNLAYLTQRTSTFASRLAYGLAAPQTQAGPLVLPIKPAAPQTPKSRVDPTIATRRLERLEREKKWAQRSQWRGDLLNAEDNLGTAVRERPPQSPPYLRRGFQRFEGSDGPSQAFNRPFDSNHSEGSQFDRHNQPSWRDGPEMSGKSGVRGGSGRVKGRSGGMKAGGVMGGRGRMNMGGVRATGGTSLGHARDGPPSIRGAVREGDQDGVRGEDVTYEILEAGGEPTEPAQLTNPDFSLINLDDVLGPSPTSKFDLVVAPQEPNSDSSLLVDLHAQRVLRVFGGQYSRFASQTPEDYVAGPQKLGPMKHAQLTLAKRRDVSVNQRLQTADIIGRIR